MASLGTGWKSWLWLCILVFTLQPGWVQPFVEAEYINFRAVVAIQYSITILYIVTVVDV